jgi:hypothetical protein
MSEGNGNVVIERGFDVAEEHRELLGGLRDLARSLIIAANNALQGTASSRVAEDSAEVRGVRAFGERDSVADVLVKLVGVVGKLIPLEREAFQLNSKVNLADLSDAQVLRLMDD